MGKVSIGIDQSYTKTGISICIDGKLSEVGSIDFKGCKTKTEKRRAVHSNLLKVIESVLEVKPEPRVIIVVERIRTYSSNTGKYGLKPNYLKSTGALIATIVDLAYDYNIPVCSADTRSWKSRIVGTSKGLANEFGVDPKKWPAIKMLKDKHGIDVSYRNKRNRLCFDDDAADSACMALYAFLPKSERTLKQEE